MLDTLRFWLDRGVDGFRMDVIHLIGKGDDLPDLTADEAKVVDRGSSTCPRRTSTCARSAPCSTSYPGDRTSVGEVFLLDPAQVAEYYGDDDELHLSFNFAPLFSRWRAASWARNIRTASEVLDDAGHWATWVLSNHDNPRHRTRYGGDERIARAAAVLLLTLRGTPFLYAGEELGLEDADVPPSATSTPAVAGATGAGRRSRGRRGRPHGWASPDTVAPVPPGARASATPRRCATTRARSCTCTATCSASAGGSAALQLGSIEVLEAPEDVLVYERRFGDDVRVVAISFSDLPVAASVGPAAVELSSDPGRARGTAFEDELNPYEAAVLRPSR